MDFVRQNYLVSRCWTGPSVKSSFFAEKVNPSANESLFGARFGGGFYSTNQNRGVFSKIKTGSGLL
jgi:hypothetical protein